MIYYRVSDNSYPKVRLPGASKRFCYSNFREVFPADPIEVIADNCGQETCSLFEDVRVHRTELSNAGSLAYAIDLATGLPDDEVAYFVEDDYLHNWGASMPLIAEGLSVADYVTLYDHPDKYSEYYGFGETCKVVRTPKSHWRHTVSTCMTFATTARTLKRDLPVWKEHTSGVHPNDHGVFTALGGLGRKLAVCIPGRANHCDLAWGQEEWAVDLLLQFYLRCLDGGDDLLRSLRDHVLGLRRDRLETLKMLHALVHRDQ